MARNRKPGRNNRRRSGRNPQPRPQRPAQPQPAPAPAPQPAAGPATKPAPYREAAKALTTDVKRVSLKALGLAVAFAILFAIFCGIALVANDGVKHWIAANDTSCALGTDHCQGGIVYAISLPCLIGVALGVTCFFVWWKARFYVTESIMAPKPDPTDKQACQDREDLVQKWIKRVRRPALFGMLLGLFGFIILLVILTSM